MLSSDQRNWTGWGFWGHKGTFFADVTGDRLADAIAVNNEGVFVRSSDGTQFRNDARKWTGWGFWGTRGTYFADVTGDGRADAIAVNEDGVWVRPSNGTAFDHHTRWLATLPNTRSGGNFFADVTGPDADGKRRADLVTVNGDGVLVNIASETGFSPTATNWTAGTFLGDWGNFFADADGDGPADALALKTGTSGGDLRVRLSNGTSFSNEYTNGQGVVGDPPRTTFYQTGLFFAQTNEDKIADVISVSHSGISILYDYYYGFWHGATDTPFYGLR